MSAPAWTTLVEPGELAAALDDAAIAIVDVRTSLGDPGHGAAAYGRGHVPGAVHLELGTDLSGPHAPGAGRHPWPSDAGFAAMLGRNGIGPAHQVVAYDDGDGAFAARAWFLLQAFGHSRVAVLHGGWAAWQAARLPVSTHVPEVVAAGPYPGRFDRNRLLDAEGVQAALGQGAPVVDARAAPRFRGEVEPIDPVAGHVPGAINRPYADNLREGRFRPRGELAQAFRSLLGDAEPDRLVASCGSGVTACHHLLAMAHAGLPGGRLYTGSWSGWIEDPTRPVAGGGEA